MSKAIALNEGTFDALTLESDVPVLVDFWASWCGPCRMLGPIIEEIAEEYEGKAKICKLDIDENSALAVRHGVMSIPTVIIFKNGEEAARFVGVQPKAVLTEAIDSSL